MNVASLELSKELYELSGWTTDGWRSGTGTTTGAYPTYNLGYLLRKLPNVVGKAWLNLAPETSYKGIWIADYQGGGSTTIESATSPEDALCKLAIELFKQGILKKETI